MKQETNNTEQVGLVGPRSIVLFAVTRRGPLPRSLSMSSLRPTRVRFANAAATPLTITSATFDPAHDITSGATAEAALATEVSDQPLAPGQSVTLELHGQVPARAGIYRSALRLDIAGGAPCSIPLEIRVSAHPAWGLVCVLLGLLVVGLTSLLDSESSLRQQRRDALRLRQEIHGSLEQVPAPLVSELPVGVFDRELDQALTLLGRNRRWSFVDRREEEAKPHLQAAQKQADVLRTAMATQALGAADSANLTQRWEQLQKTFTTLAQQFPVTTPPGDAFAARLDSFDAWATQRILAPTLGYAGMVFPYDLARVQLLYSAGRTPEAANLAETTRRGLQRYADLVREQAELLAFFRQTSANNLFAEQRLRQHLAATPLAPERRAAIARMLDESTALLRPPYSWTERRDVAKRIEQTVTELFRSQQELALAAAAAARTQEEAEDSIAPIQQVIDQGGALPKDSAGKILPEAKFAWLQQVAGAWRARLSSFPEPNPPVLITALQAFEQAIAGRNLDDISARLRTLLDQWQHYSTDRALQQIHRAMAPFCMSLREDIFTTIETTRQNLHDLGAHPQLIDWENRLEALRMRAAATPESVERMEAGSLEELSVLSSSVSAFSNEVSSAQWDRATLSPSAKRWLVGELGGTLTQSTMDNLLAEVRVLGIRVLTPPDEHYAGRELRLGVTNLDPAWKHGVQVRLDFGDGAAQTLNAEDLAHNCWFTHTYAHQGSYPLRASAILCEAATQNGALRPDSDPAQSKSPQLLKIAASPVSAAARLAETFFNIRYALALVIAAGMYFWRFQAKTTAFGANSLDYAWAFSCGFAASLAVDKLPDTISKFFS